MSEKEKKETVKDDEQMTTNTASAFQDEVQPKSQDEEVQPKRAKVTSPTATMLQDVPMELLERIFMEAIVSEVRDRKIFRSAWKRSGGRVLKRLRNVCPQWDRVLNTESFRHRLHDFMINNFAQAEICFEVLAKRHLSKIVTVAAMNDEVYVLCQPQRQAYIEVYSHDDLWTVKRTIQLPDVTIPWDLVACSVSDCLYVLHQASRDIAILRISKEGQQFQVSHFITCSPQIVSRLCVAGDGKLILFQGPAPAKITVYDVDGTLEHQTELEKPISYINGVLSKSYGNFVLVKKTTLTEVGRDGNTLYEYKRPSGEYLYGAIDQYDRIVITDEGGVMRLLDYDFNSVKVKFRLDSFQGNMHFYRMSYNRKRNEFLAFESAAFCDNDTATQGLTVFSFTERSIPNDAQKKKKK